MELHCISNSHILIPLKNKSPLKEEITTYLDKGLCKDILNIYSTSISQSFPKRSILISCSKPALGRKPNTYIFLSGVIQYWLQTNSALLVLECHSDSLIRVRAQEGQMINRIYSVYELTLCLFPQFLNVWLEYKYSDTGKIPIVLPCRVRVIG